MLKNSKSPLALILLPLFAFVASGCLTAERKELIFTVKPDGSGSGRITFYNIMSVEEEGKDASLGDYTELINRYLKGTKFEDFYPLYMNLKKRLYEENGRLNGELTFDFGHYEDVGLYRYQDKGPWMYFIGVKSDFGVERYDTSTGTVPSEQMPLVFWPEGTTEFRISSRYDNTDAARHTLFPLYRRIGID